MFPSQQRLDGKPLATGEVELGLEQHAQLVMIERAPEGALSEEP
jgi:hypothetical protein